MDIKKRWRELEGEDFHGFTTYQNTDVEHLDEVFGDFVRMCPLDARIIEIGCNTGTNLEYLRKKGYSKFAGIEINEAAAKNFATVYPETFDLTDMYVGDAIEMIEGIDDDSFDVVVTKGCLMNIPYTDRGIFDHINRIVKSTILIKEADPIVPGSVMFEYDYEEIFSDYGFQLILKKLIIAGRWGTADVQRRKNPWLRVFVRQSDK